MRQLHVWWSHPPEHRGDRPVVVALHGRGADETSLAVLADDLPDGVVLACPRGPVPEGLGAAWWQMHVIGYPVAASLARTRADCAGVRIAYAHPDRLGVDRFLALLAAHARGNGPSLLCGVGTALTLDLLDRDGCHLGGRIAPSPTLMREALHARAAQLPIAGGEYCEFATDTEDALASGCQGAALGLIEHSIAAARRRLGTAPSLLLHGGGGEPLMPHLPAARWAPGLVLEGLAVWVGVERA
ncbi:MAG: type III pantothenate kinase [Proteobacteria bacterium]|nr:type III pantothenate kinase [Pseudomonadota bacterium]